MMELERENHADSQTLIGLQNSLICPGTWLSVEQNNWSIEIDHFKEENLEMRWEGIIKLGINTDRKQID